MSEGILILGKLQRRSEGILSEKREVSYTIFMLCFIVGMKN
jgi:hypothetical protein